MSTFIQNLYFVWKNTWWGSLFLEVLYSHKCLLSSATFRFWSFFQLPHKFLSSPSSWFPFTSQASQSEGLCRGLHHYKNQPQRSVIQSHFACCFLSDTSRRWCDSSVFLICMLFFMGSCLPLGFHSFSLQWKGAVRCVQRIVSAQVFWETHNLLCPQNNIFTGLPEELTFWGDCVSPAVQNKKEKKNG